MLAGGIVDGGAGKPGAVSAYVAFNPEPGISRLFKVSGPTSAPVVEELGSATTIDLGRFRRDLEEELAPTVQAIREAGGQAGIADPKPEWIASIVERHLAG